ncbi:hypothetical protein EA798_11650 [Pseudomonas songnenensis]|uniref:Uncharacterized protein n=1 Tax=Pseudomonas songnenensis TaxID=1176259 RepID=A0ABX9UVS3_9PSED|nr:hypothetical protein EA798_11650 [Pseudomonas songnenensis]
MLWVGAAGHPGSNQLGKSRRNGQVAMGDRTRSVRFIEYQEQCLCQQPAEQPVGREFTQQQMKV